MPRTPRRRRILVVDDHADIRRLVRDILSPLGYETEEAASGRTALRRLKERRYDAVLTDHRMPGMTGSELLDRMREEGLQVAALVMTGSVDEGLEAWLRRRPRVKLLAKPFGPRALARAVASLVKK